MDVYRPVRFSPEPAVVFVHSLGRDEAEWALAGASGREQGFVQAAFGWSGGYDLSALAQSSFGWSQLIATYLTGCPLVACADRYAYASAVRFVDRGDPPARIVNSSNEL